MEEDATPSTSQDVTDMDFGERSFLDEHFKGDFTNALIAAKSIYEEQGLLTDKPPERITSVSLAMAKEISKITINVLNENIVITDEELILFDETDDKHNFKEVFYYFYITTIIIFNFYCNNFYFIVIYYCNDLFKFFVR